MRILVVAADGFLGTNIKTELAKYHDVYTTSRHEKENEHTFFMDLTSPETIRRVLNIVQPDVIISCAGIVNASEDTDLNVVFTRNLLIEVSKMKTIPRRIIISGSAAEYGNITRDQLPVSETTPLSAHQGYGLSKLKEEETAHYLAMQYNLPVVVVRIFNPIGKGMGSRFLIPNLIKQILEYKKGQRDYIELSRLDSRRDYVSVSDIATAIRAITEGFPSYTTYNIGSGVSTSNEQLLHMLFKNMNLRNLPPVKQTSDIVEPLVAIQADIMRLTDDFKWKPSVKLEDTVREITNA